MNWWRWKRKKYKHEEEEARAAKKEAADRLYRAAKDWDEVHDAANRFAEMWEIAMRRQGNGS